MDLHLQLQEAYYEEINRQRQYKSHCFFLPVSGASGNVNKIELQSAPMCIAWMKIAMKMFGHLNHPDKSSPLLCCTCI